MKGRLCFPLVVGMISFLLVAIPFAAQSNSSGTNAGSNPAEQSHLEQAAQPTNQDPRFTLPTSSLYSRRPRCIDLNGFRLGAGRGSRTPKGGGPADFESAASASSVIPADSLIHRLVHGWRGAR